MITNEIEKSWNCEKWSLTQDQIKQFLQAKDVFFSAFLLSWDEFLWNKDDINSLKCSSSVKFLNLKFSLFLTTHPKKVKVERKT